MRSAYIGRAVYTQDQDIITKSLPERVSGCSGASVTTTTMPGCILSRNLATKTSFGTQALQKAVRRFLGPSPIVMTDHGPTHAERARMRAYPPIDFTTRQRRPVSVACVQWCLVALRYDVQSVCSAMRSANRSDRSDPVTPANNPKSGNAFSDREGSKQAYKLLIVAGALGVTGAAVGGGL